MVGHITKYENEFNRICEWMIDENISNRQESLNVKNICVYTVVELVFVKFVLNEFILLDFKFYRNKFIKH